MSSQMIVVSPSSLVAWVKGKRLEKGLSQAELAASAGVPQPTISNFERGKINITLETLYKLLPVLGLTLAVVDLHEKAADEKTPEW